ncbi:MAG: anhydro-N-acetylmuramic acid kinase [Pedobacter sp.]|nr:anhydro-N-acetylmuramic acid kinase [Pedobacter sp.]
MNANIAKLYQIANQKERMIIGLMSGTSMDGLDVALCRISGSGLATELELLNFATMPYTDEFRKSVKAIFSKRDADLEQVCLMNEVIAITHATLILRALEQWNRKPEHVDAIASHGQSIFHAPKSLHQLPNLPNGTLQIGDGDHIAVKTGIITLSDFRQKHIAAGGEGAPLAVYANKK